MKSNVEKLLELELQYKNGIAYIVTTKWWEQFKERNEQAKQISQIAFPNINFDKFVDTFLIQFQQGIVAQIQHKSNYLKFSQVILSPQIKQNVQWTLISPDLWKMIQAKTKTKYSLITIYNQKNPSSIFSSQCTQVQIIFCSKSKSTLFVGFLPNNADAVTCIRNIGYQLNYVQMDNSRIMFPDKNTDKTYFYCELQNKNIQQCHDTLFLVFNLECIQQQGKKQQKLDFSFGKGQDQANSIQALAGDIGVKAVQSFELVRNDGTMSTGAQTPSFFGSDDGNNNRQFRVRQLFRSKTFQQIQQLRMKACKKVNGPLIAITQNSEQKIRQNLEAIQFDLIDHINAHKKKTHKQKEVHFQ